MDTAILLLILWWWGLGVYGFIYWWIREFDLEIVDAIGCLFVGFFFGPLAWLVGWFLHSTYNNPPKILIKKRGRND